ncbi:MAG: 50S ribosomal protein L31 [Elusimicrobia bacterium]|nr:50S ribosomal protein L31 [Elusimicrobiota bacterium]
MKPGIHPVYAATTVRCACGNAFTTRSVRPDIKVEICSECHPFYTGRQKLVDTAGRVDRFKKRFAKTEGKMIERKPVAEVKMKKLESVAGAKRKILSTAPTAAPAKAEKKGKKEPAKKD